MNKATPAEEKKLDNLVAEFADQVLNTNEEIHMSDINQANELAKLQRTILVLKAAVKDAQPDENVRARIHRKLLSATQAQQVEEKSTPRPQKVLRFALASGFALLLLVGLLLVPLPGTELPLSASAEGSPAWLPFIIIIGGVAIIALLAWFNRQR